jgi:hypothetical protein
LSSAAAIANVGGQLLALCVGVGVGEGLLGLPANEDGWQADLCIAVSFGTLAACYGAAVFAAIQLKWPARNVPVALATGCLNGLLLTAIMSGTEVVSERASNALGCVALALVVVGPVVGAALSHLVGRSRCTGVRE